MIRFFAITSLPASRGILPFSVSFFLSRFCYILRTRPAWLRCLIWESHTTGHFIVWKVMCNLIHTVFSNPNWGLEANDKASVLLASVTIHESNAAPTSDHNIEGRDILTKVLPFSKNKLSKYYYLSLYIGWLGSCILSLHSTKFPSSAGSHIFKEFIIRRNKKIGKKH
jgi:hypothetical protein